MNLSEIERTLGKDKVDALLGGDDPQDAIIQAADNIDPRRQPRQNDALVALYALVYTRVWSRKHDGE